MNAEAWIYGTVPTAAEAINYIDPFLRPASLFFIVAAPVIVYMVLWNLLDWHRMVARGVAFAVALVINPVAMGIIMKAWVFCGAIPTTKAYCDANGAIFHTNEVAEYRYSPKTGEVTTQ